MARLEFQSTDEGLALRSQLHFVVTIRLAFTHFENTAEQVGVIFQIEFHDREDVRAVEVVIGHRGTPAIPAISLGSESRHPEVLLHRLARRSAFCNHRKLAMCQMSLSRMGLGWSFSIVFPPKNKKYNNSATFTVETLSFD